MMSMFVRGSRSTLLAFATLGLLVSASACEGGSDLDDPIGEGESESETGEPPPAPDSDQDGLSDDEEAELGTDPHDKDSDDDNYWDSWEVVEGTDPLDLESRIYRGWWPYRPNKDELPQGSWDTASTEPGSYFPRAAFHDRHGDLVDVYDFGEFTINSTGEPAFIVMDVSAQWCGPCHIMASFVGGVVHPDTAALIENFPSIPEKIHDLRVWWMTFIVEGGDGGPPNVEDTEVWFSVHPDNYIPVFADEEQLVLEHFGGMWFPFMFLVDPQMRIHYWDDDPPNAEANYVLDFVEAL
jgi:hypothetical protein